MRQAHTCSQVWAPVHTASAPKQSKLDVMLKFQPLSSQDCHSLNLRGGGDNRECSNVTALVSVHRQEQCHAKWPSSCRDFQYPAGFKLTSPHSLLLAETTKPWFCINQQKKWYMHCHFSQTWTELLLAGSSFLDCSSWISRSDKIYYNSWPKTFEQHILSQSTYIWNEIFSLCTIFSHCSSCSSSTQEKRSENLKISTDLQDCVIDSWSVAQKMFIAQVEYQGQTRYT